MAHHSLCGIWNRTFALLLVATVVSESNLRSPCQAQESNVSRRITGKEQAAGTQVILNEVDTSQFPKVRIYATVLKNGQPIKGLNAEDFRVREDEVDQEPLAVEPKLPPLSVVLTLDTSGSMAKRIKDAQAAARSFLETLNPSDSVQVVSFAREIRRLTSMSTNRETAAAAIDGTVARGDTALFDALHESVNLLKERAGRKAVVLLSDGVDDDGTGQQLSKHTAGEVLKLTREVNVPIYVIGLGTEIDEANLVQIARESGAQYYNASQASELKNLYDAIGEQLAGQYAIRYTSNLPADGTEHRIALAAQGVTSTKIYKAPGNATRQTAIDGAPKVADGNGNGLPDWVPLFPGVTPKNLKVYRATNGISGGFIFESEASTSELKEYYLTTLKRSGFRVDGAIAGAVVGSQDNAGRKVRFSPFEKRVTFVEAFLSNGATEGDSKVKSSGSDGEGVPSWVPLYPGTKPKNVKIHRTATGVSGGFVFESEAGNSELKEFYTEMLTKAGFDIGDSVAGALNADHGESGRQVRFTPFEKRVTFVIAGKEANLENRDAPGTKEAVGNPDLAKLPDWVPLFPGTEPKNLKIHRTSKGMSGGFIFESAADVLELKEFYSRSFKNSGLQVGNATADAITGEDASKGRQVRFHPFEKRVTFVEGL